MAKKKHRPVPSETAAASPAEIREAAYFARKCGLTRDEALEMIREANASTAIKPAGQRKAQALSLR